jgi:hypothetical protein
MAVAEKSAVAAESAAIVVATEVVGASEVLAAETGAHMPATKSTAAEVAAAKAAMGDKHGGSAAKSTTLAKSTTHLAATKSATHMATTKSATTAKSTTTATTATTSCQRIARYGSTSERDRCDDECDLVHHDFPHR